MSGGFFRGTSAEQDTRFSNKQAKLLKTQKFPPELEHLVDVTKVKMDVIKPWIAKRVTELLGFEDEVLINFIYGLLEGKEINGKQVQIQLTGFMEKNTGKFMRELWALLLSAQKNASGVPQQFLDAKEEETRKKKAETDRIFNEIQRRKEKETKEFEHERVRKMDGGLDDNSAEELNRRAGRGPDAHSGDEIGAGETNGFRGRKRSSKSPYSSEPSPSPHRIGRSRSVSKSYSNSRSYSKERSISRSISESPRARRRSVSPERMNQSRRSVTPRRRSARESISPRRRSRSGRRSSSYSRRSPSPVRRRFRSPLRRRSPSPARRRSRTPLRRRSRTPLRRRSRTPLRRRSRSPRWRHSPSPRWRFSPSPRWRRSRTPVWHRSPSPRRRRSPSPVRWRRSPSPVRRRRQRSTSSSRSRSPVQRRRLSPVRRRFQSPVHGRSPIPARRRSPSPDQSRSLSSGGPISRSPVRRRSPSPVSRRSPVPARRSPAPAQRRSPTPSSSRSRSPASQSSALPMRRGSVSPPRLQKSPRESPKERIRNQEPAELEPTMRARRQPISLSPQRDRSDKSRSRRKIPSVSPSPEKSPSYMESPQTRTRLSADRRLASSYESPGNRTLDRRTHDRSHSPPSKSRGQRARHASPVRSDEELENFREDEGTKYKVTKRESVRSSAVKSRVSPDRPVSHRHHDSTDPRDKENEMRREEVNMKEVRSSKKSPHKSSVSGERHDASYPRVGSKSDDKRSIHSKDGRDNGRSDSLVNIDKKVKRRSPSVESDSRSDGSDKPEAGIAEKRKHRRSSHREASDDTSSESELENRKETKRRRKEEKKIRKEERRRRREEKRRRREEKRASKRKRKSKGPDISSSDMEKREKDVNASNGEQGSRKYSSEDEETESQKKRLEIELREKALESLRAKKGISR